MSDWHPIEIAPTDGTVIKLKGRFQRWPDSVTPAIVDGHYDTGGHTEGWETEGGAWFIPDKWKPL